MCCQRSWGAVLTGITQVAAAVATGLQWWAHLPQDRLFQARRLLGGHRRATAVFPWWLGPDPLAFQMVCRRLLRMGDRYRGGEMNRPERMRRNCHRFMDRDTQVMGFGVNADCLDARHEHLRMATTLALGFHWLGRHSRFGGLGSLLAHCGVFVLRCLLCKASRNVLEDHAVAQRGGGIL